MQPSRDSASEGERLLAGYPVARRTRTSHSPIVCTPLGRLFGYERESARLRAIAERGTLATIGIRGAGGTGKTEFLVRALRPEQTGSPRATLFISAGHLAAEDIIALVSDFVFAVRGPRERSPASACSATLVKCRLLLALDDVRSAEDLACVRAAFPNSCICFTSEREFQNAADEWIELSGLATNDGVALLQDVAEPNRLAEETAASIVANLRGNPSRVRCAASLGVPLPAIAADFTSPDGFDEFQLSLVRTRLSPDEFVRLAAVASFGDAALNDEKATAALAQGSFIERSSVGWAVPHGLRQKLNQLEFDDVKAAQALLDALRRTNGTLAKRRSLVECAAGLLTGMRRGGAPARAAARIVAREIDERGLWCMSAALYEALRASAASAGDSAMRTWATHQLGARRAHAGDVDSAHNLVPQAPLSQKSGEVANRALTEASLAELRRAGPSPNGGVARPLKTKALLVGAGLALAGAVALLPSLVGSVFVPRPELHLVTRPVPSLLTMPTEHLGWASLPATARAVARAGSVLPQTMRGKTGVSGLVEPSTSRPIARGSRRYRRAAWLAREGHPPRAWQVAPPSILMLSMLPRKVLPRGTATLCISADRTQRLFITGLGEFNPKLTTCHTVSPKKTTTFTAYAIDERGRQAMRTITVVVLRSQRRASEDRASAAELIDR
jgi:hypothetical protein